MSGPVETQLQLALAIPDPRKRLAALRALLPRLTGAPRRRAEAAIREAQAVIASLGSRPKPARGKSGRAGSRPRKPRAKAAAARKAAPATKAAAKKAAPAKKPPTKKAPATKSPTKKRGRLPQRLPPPDLISPPTRVRHAESGEGAPAGPATWVDINREVADDDIHLPRGLDDAPDTPIPRGPLDAPLGLEHTVSSPPRSLDDD